MVLGEVLLLGEMEEGVCCAEVVRSVEDMVEDLSDVVKRYLEECSVVHCAEEFTTEVCNESLLDDL